MALEAISCSKCVGVYMTMIKYGKTKSGNQRYICKLCSKTKVANYIYNAYHPNIDSDIKILTKEGLGVRSTARVLKISPNTLLRRILLIAQKISQPLIGKGNSYEVDEIRSFIKRKDKLIWIVYALERKTNKVVSFNVGNRSNNTLNGVITSIKLSSPSAIYTDKLKHYKYLIDPSIHKTIRFGTNHIERKNLSLRTHLKRLNRKTICFTKSKSILIAILKIYFWS